MLSGCATEQAYTRPGADKGYSVTGKDPFVFEVDRQTLREWGGPNSPQFNRMLEAELERHNICRRGYALRNERLRGETFSVIGRCRF